MKALRFLNDLQAWMDEAAVLGDAAGVDEAAVLDDAAGVDEAAGSDKAAVLDWGHRRVVLGVGGLAWAARRRVRRAWRAWRSPRSSSWSFAWAARRTCEERCRG